MNLDTTRYRNQHRSEPVRESVFPQRKIDDCFALFQWGIMVVCFDSGHLSHHGIEQVGLIIISNGRINIQIPIDRSLF